MAETNLTRPVAPVDFYDGEAPEESLDFKEIWRVVRFHRYMILISLALVLGSTIFFTVISQPVYEATTVVLLRKNPAGAGSLIFDITGMQSQQQINNEVEILKSYTLNENVVKHLVQTGACDTLYLFGTRYVRRRYRLLSWLRSLFLKDTLEQVDPYHLTREQMLDIVDRLQENTDIEPTRDADIIKIKVRDHSPFQAMLLANTLAEQYQDFDLAGERGEIHFVLTFLDSQITKYRKRLAEVEDRLQKFQEENQIYSLEGEAQLLLEELNQYESTYNQSKASLEVAQARLRYMKGKLSENQKKLVEDIVNTNNPMVVALRKRIADVEAQKVQQMVDEGWKPNSLQAKDFDRRIAKMKKKLAELTKSIVIQGFSEEDPFQHSQELFNKIIEEEVEVYALQAQVKQYESLVQKLDQRLNSLPERTLQYARLERERKLTEELYLAMKQKYEESRITEAGQLGKVRILDRAVTAEIVSPKVKLNILLGIVLGFGLGIGLAFFREYLDDSIKSVEQLERKGLTLLGVIPSIEGNGAPKEAEVEESSRGHRTRGGHRFRRRLITYINPRSPISEAYRTLRTNITYSSADKPIKSVAITSSGPGEGKSTTVANLAIAFAQLRKKTLLIDTDLRKPILHNVFQIKRNPGLTEYLVGDIDDFNSLVQETRIENLYLVPCGQIPPNPSELLGSNRMAELVAQLEQEWDIVIFDTPPLGVVTDAAMISAEIDAVVLVVRAGETTRAAVDRALDALSHVKAHLAGAVLNEAHPEKLGGKYGYYYSYYYYYYYYGEDGEKKKKRHKKTKRGMRKFLNKL